MTEDSIQSLAVCASSVKWIHDLQFMPVDHYFTFRPCLYPQFSSCDNLKKLEAFLIEFSSPLHALHIQVKLIKLITSLGLVIETGAKHHKIWKSWSKIHSKRCHQPKLTYPITTAHAVFLLSRSFFSFFYLKLITISGKWKRIQVHLEVSLAKFN